MAIALDNSSEASLSSGTVLTFSHTVSGDNRILFVSCSQEGGSLDSITGITYNGISMTRIGMAVSQANGRAYLYYLIAPATGANDVVVTYSETTNKRGQAVSYTGVSQSGVPDASDSGNGSGTTITGTITTVLDNCWTIMTAYGNNAGLVASTGSTERLNNNRLGTFDSNGVITPAAETTMVVTCSSDNNGFVIASFAPFVAPTANSNFFQLF